MIIFLIHSLLIPYFLLTNDDNDYHDFYYSLLTALGPEEANKQLRRHWRTWVTEKEILSLKASGLDTLRIPVGDWMYAPYGPFVGCMDGALDELNRVLRLCEKHDLKAVLDIHAMKGSQVRSILSILSILFILSCY